MQKLTVGLLVGLLWLCPLVIDVGRTVQAGEQNPEQGRLLTKDQIRLVQQRLKSEGADPGPIDGVMNHRTEAALRQYQEKHGLPISGTADDVTLKQLQIQTTPGGTGGQ
jgi:peptidoglycan hydrolase-like protein with peptidoglycan-binding domain